MSKLVEIRMTPFVERFYKKADGDSKKEICEKIYDESQRLEKLTLKEIHAEVDELLEGMESSCAKCPKPLCCYYEIKVSKGEKELLKDRPDTNTGPGCRYLKNGRCSVYNDRPLTCRTRHVRSAPAMCDPKLKVAVMEAYVPKLELLLSAFYTNAKEMVNLNEHKS